MRKRYRVENCAVCAINDCTEKNIIYKDNLRATPQPTRLIISLAVTDEMPCEVGNDPLRTAETYIEIRYKSYLFHVAKSISQSWLLSIILDMHFWGVGS